MFLASSEALGADRHGGAAHCAQACVLAPRCGGAAESLLRGADSGRSGSVCRRGRLLLLLPPGLGRGSAGRTEERRGSARSSSSASVGLRRQQGTGNEQRGLGDNIQLTDGTKHAQNTLIKKVSRASSDKTFDKFRWELSGHSVLNRQNDQRRTRSRDQVKPCCCIFWPDPCKHKGPNKGWL